MSHDETDAPWWLEPGTETCEFCQRSFTYEAGYFCLHCDRPICPVCVKTVPAARGAVCPECHARADHDTQEGGG
ncbi:MAG: hypothetical protein UMU75_05570 [Halomonas sp.]|nr:hypothetical protein [Halomonas sp.]